MSFNDLEVRSPRPSGEHDLGRCSGIGPEPAPTTKGTDGTWSLLVAVAFEERRRLALHALARRLVPDDSAAHDLVQEAIRRVYVRPPRSLTEDAVAACLFTTVDRLGLNELRRRSRAPELRDFDDEGEPTEEGKDAAERLARTEALATAVSRLSPRQGQVVRASLLEGASLTQVATRLGLTEDSVERTLRRALENLRRRLCASAELREIFGVRFRGGSVSLK